MNEAYCTAPSTATCRCDVGYRNAGPSAALFGIAGALYEYVEALKIDYPKVAA